MSLIAPVALAATSLVHPVAAGWQLLVAALAGIALIVALITALKVHPFLALILGAGLVGAVAGQNLNDVVTSFSNGFGSTAASVGLLIALGAMFAKLLADSGGADQIVDTIVGRASARALPWAMVLVGAIIGLPMFFEIGLVLLMPVIYLVSRRSGLSLVTVGLPALAGLSAMHGFVPPHPGPLTAVQALHADLGLTLALGIVVAIPAIVVAGPLFGRIAGRWIDVPAPTTFEAPSGFGTEEHARRPSFGMTLASILLPVVLMLAKSLADIIIDDSTQRLQQILDVLGTPLVALLIAVLVGIFTLGRPAGMGRAAISSVLEKSLPPIVGILLIVSAGGGFKQVLVDTGIGTQLADWAKGANFSMLFLAWLLAVLIRLATGSATVATITASSLVTGLVQGISSTELSLVVLAIGAGSVFFSHVNDAGFWLVKEYFGLSVGQTVKSWSIMETLLSVVGLVVVLLLNLVV